MRGFKQNSDMIKLRINRVSLTDSLRIDLRETRLEKGGYFSSPCEKQ